MILEKISISKEEFRFSSFWTTLLIRNLICFTYLSFFRRLNKLSSDGDVILSALKKSEDTLIEVDLENKKIRRNPEMPLPESEDDETKKLKTVYVKGFEKTNTTLDDLLGKSFDFKRGLSFQRHGLVLGSQGGGAERRTLEIQPKKCGHSVYK